jgi:hypothetical protein
MPADGVSAWAAARRDLTHTAENGDPHEEANDNGGRGARRGQEAVACAEEREGAAAGALDVICAPALRAHERLGGMHIALLCAAHPLQ